MANTVKINEWGFCAILYLIPFAAFLYPEMGTWGGFKATHLFNQVCTAAIFIMRGLCVDMEKMRQAARNIKLNLTVQLFCFVFTPLLVLGLCRWVFPYLRFSSEFFTGSIILSCLPITAASCIVFTMMVRGDEEAAIVNSVFSNFFGAFFAPLAIGILLEKELKIFQFNPFPAMGELIYLIILPMIIGQMLRLMPLKIDFSSKKLRRRFHRISEGIILLIIYIGFCNSVAEIKAAALPWINVLLLTLGMLVLNLLLLGFAFLAGKVLKFNIRDCKTMLCTAPQKTIIVGIPLVMAILTASSAAHVKSHFGLYLLPLLIYYNVKWLVAGALATPLSRWGAKE